MHKSELPHWLKENGYAKIYTHDGSVVGGKRFEEEWTIKTDVDPFGPQPHLSTVRIKKQELLKHEARALKESKFFMSYQGRARKDKELFPSYRQIAIMRRPQRWWTGEVHKLASPSDFILDSYRKGRLNWREDYFRELSENCDPVTLVQEFGPEAILYCCEKDPSDCHRKAFAEWLNIYTDQIYLEASEAEKSPRTGQLSLF